MRHRIFVDAIQPDIAVTGEEFHHAARVVRVREGEEVEVFDRSGRCASGVVALLAKDSLTVRTREEVPSREARIRLHLAMAVIDLDRFELVLQKATELGVASIVPLVTDRVQIRRERYAGKTERWQKVIFEAVKQSGRSRIPLLEAPLAYAEALARPGAKLFFDADAEADARSGGEEATLFIGPEGGWSERELADARAAGGRFVRLGPRRLRAETAAIVALAITAFRSGELT